MPYPQNDPPLLAGVLYVAPVGTPPPGWRNLPSREDPAIEAWKVIGFRASSLGYLAGLVADETARWARRQRRLRTHVWEHPTRSRMHATYRAKTRRRNYR